MSCYGKRGCTFEQDEDCPFRKMASADDRNYKDPDGGLGDRVFYPAHFPRLWYPANRWYQVLLVYSGSMAPAVQPGDLIIITRPPEQLKEGMILTLQVNGQVVTHRLIQITPDGGLVTKGDANPVADDWSGQDVFVRGLYRGYIPYLGHLLNLPQKWLRIGQSGSWFTDSYGQDILDLQAGKIKPTKPPKPKHSADLEIEVEVRERDREVVSIHLCLINHGKAAPESLQVVSELFFTGPDNVLNPVEGTRVEIKIREEIEPDEPYCEKVVRYSNLEPGKSYIQMFRISYTNHTGWLPGQPNCPGETPCIFQVEVNTPFSVTAPPQNTPKPTSQPRSPVVTIPPGKEFLTPTPVQPDPTEQPTQTPEVLPTEEPTETQPTDPATPTEEPTPKPTPSPVPGL